MSILLPTFVTPFGVALRGKTDAGIAQSVLVEA